MAASERVDWDVCERCREEGGIGVRLPSGGKCWAHADDPDLDAALKRLGEDGRLDARGVPITQELLGRLLAAVPRNEPGHPTLTDTQCNKATFQGDAVFIGMIFQGNAMFHDVTFQRLAWFDEVTFLRGAGFRRATFKGDAMLADATFRDLAVFGDATFQRVWFNGATFRGGAMFIDATFHRDASFDRAAFHRDARFDKATFQRHAGFGGTTFYGDTHFDGATFQQARQLGPMLVRRSLLLDQVVFHERVQVEVVAAAVRCQRARFLAGVQLRMRWAQVVLDDADLSAPAIVAGAPVFKAFASQDLDERGLLASWELAGPGGPPRPEGQPWVASLCRADVAGLAIANADLQACSFAGAHNLDRLRLESPKAFTAAPGLKAVATGWAWPPVWWWTRRQTLAEEHAWRAAHERGIRQAGWHTGETWPASSSRWVPNPPRPARDLGHLERHAAQAVRDWHRPHWLRRRLALAWHIVTARVGQEQARRREATRLRQKQAREVANLYRALRKAREDAKDEPGAADFYYGEMELRRHATPRWSVERAVLTLYWLLAGYGLRAWRAFAALTAILVLAAWLLVHSHGFAAPQTMTFWGALRYSGRTAIGLLPKDQPALTPWGDVLQITVRVTVPVLLGLAVLSIRGRVKR